MRRKSKLRSFAAILATFIAVWFAVLFATAQPFVKPIPSSSPEPNQARMRETVKHLAETLYPRSYDQPERLEAAGLYLRDQLQATGANVELQKFTAQGETFFNVIARFGPATGSKLVIDAHFDSYADRIALRKAASALAERHTRQVPMTMLAGSQASLSLPFFSPRLS